MIHSHITIECNISEYLSSEGIVDGAAVGQFFILVTNRLEQVDERLRNNGRFEVEIDVPVPDEADRARILRFLASKMAWADSVGIELVAQRSHGYVASDLCSLVKRTFLQAMEQNCAVTTELLLENVKQITPSAMKTVQVRVRKFFFASFN